MGRGEGASESTGAIPRDAGADDLLDALDSAGGELEYEPAADTLYAEPQVSGSEWVINAYSVISAVEELPPSDTARARELVSGLLASDASVRPPRFGQLGVFLTHSYKSESERAMTMRERISLALLDHERGADETTQGRLLDELRNEVIRRELLEMSRSPREMVEFLTDKFPEGIKDIANACSVKPPTVKRWLSGANCGSTYVLRELSAFFFYTERVLGWSSERTREWLTTPSSFSTDRRDFTGPPISWGLSVGVRGGLTAAAKSVGLDDLSSWSGWARPDNEY